MKNESLNQSVRQFSEQNGSSIRPWLRAGLLCMVLFEEPAGHLSPDTEMLCDKNYLKGNRQICVNRKTSAR